MWIVNQYAATPSQAGPMRHYDLAYELVQRGHDATIIASSFDHFSHIERRLRVGESHRYEMVDGIRYVWLRSPAYSNNGGRRIWNMLHFAVAVVKRGEAAGKSSPPDVIIGSSPTLFAALGAKQLAHRYGVPFVLEVRDLWPKSLVDIGKVPEMHPVVLALSLLERYLYLTAAHVITLLPGAKEYIACRGGKTEAISWLPNGVRLNSERMDEKTKLNSRLTVLYAGAHGTANGLDTVLEAAFILDKRGFADRVAIHLLGNGPQKARLQARVAEEHIRSIRFFDEVPQKVVADRLAQADALLLPLRKADLYSFGVSPNKLYHYMAAERPIVFATGSSNNPVQEAGAGLTIPPEDPRALADAIVYLASISEEDRQAMGRRGRKYVEQYHRIERLGQELEQILANLVPMMPVRSMRMSKAS